MLFLKKKVARANFVLFLKKKRGWGMDFSAPDSREREAEREGEVLLVRAHAVLRPYYDRPAEIIPFRYLPVLLKRAERPKYAKGLRDHMSRLIRRERPHSLSALTLIYDASGACQHSVSCTHPYLSLCQHSQKKKSGLCQLHSPLSITLSALTVSYWPYSL